MSTQKKVAPEKKVPMQESNQSESTLPFKPTNYKLMLLGVVVIFSGFVIMSLETAEFGFGFLGLTLGPLVLMAGFIIEFFAIMHKKKA